MENVVLGITWEDAESAAMENGYTDDDALYVETEWFNKIAKNFQEIVSRTIKSL